MNLRMTDKNILVRPIFEAVSDSGIVVKQNVLPKTLWGEVLAVANHCDCADIFVGSKVLFHKHAGTNVKVDSEILRIIPIVDIEAVEVESWEI